MVITQNLNKYLSYLYNLTYKNLTILVRTVTKLIIIIFNIIRQINVYFYDEYLTVYLHLT